MGEETKTVIYVTDQGQNNVFVQACQQNFDNLRYIVIDYNDKNALEGKIKAAFHSQGSYLFVLDCQNPPKLGLKKDVEQKIKQEFADLLSKKKQLKTVLECKEKETILKQTEKVVSSTKQVISNLESEVRNLKVTLQQKRSTSSKVKREYKRIEGQVKRFFKRQSNSAKKQYNKLKGEIASIEQKIRNNEVVIVARRKIVRESERVVKDVKEFLGKQKELKDDVVKTGKALEDKLGMLKPQVKLALDMGRIVKWVNEAQPNAQANYLVVHGQKVNHEIIRPLLKSGEQFMSIGEAKYPVVGFSGLRDMENFVATLKKAEKFYQGKFSFVKGVYDFLATDYNSAALDKFSQALALKITCDGKTLDFNKLPLPKTIMQEQVNLIHQRLGDLKSKDVLNSVISKMKNSKTLGEIEFSLQGTALAIQYITR